MTIPRYLLPIIVLCALLSGYLLRLTFTQPTTAVSFGSAQGKSLTCVVDGLKCKGTANFFTQLYKDQPGIIDIETFATEHRAVFTYDPRMTGPDGIRQVMETPIPLRDGTLRQVFVCQSMQ